MTVDFHAIFKEKQNILDEYKLSIKSYEDKLASLASELDGEGYKELSWKLEKARLLFENLEYQVDECEELFQNEDEEELEENTTEIDFETTSFDELGKKYELIVENVTDIEATLKSSFIKIDGSEHRLEVGESTKHRVGAWEPQSEGSKFLAYGLFRNKISVAATPKFTSTSIILFIDEEGEIMSFDVETKFTYSWGFGRQRAMLLDFVANRTRRVTIVAIVCSYSPGAASSVKRKCFEIMDHTATRLAFECQDFNEEIEKHRKSSEEQKAASKNKIDELNSDLDQARGTITELDEKLEASNGVLLEMQEHYVSLFEDTLDELADVIEQEEPVGTYLDGKEEMVSERRKLLESVSSCRSRIQSDLDKHNDMKKLLQEYEQEAKVQLAENKAMKEEIAKLEKEMGEQGLDTIKEQLNAAHASFSEEILKLKADQSDEINALEQIIEEKTKFINLQDEKIKNFLKDEIIHKKNLEEERSKFQELEEKLLSSFEEKLHDREQSHDSEIKKLNMAIEDLQNSQNEELENGQERVDRLSDANDELKEKNEKLSKELDDLKNSNKEPEESVFREENEKLEKVIDALRSEMRNISTGSESVQDFKNLLEENEKLREEICALESRVTPAEDIKKLNEEMDSLKKQIYNFEDLELRREEELFSLNEKIAKLEDADLTTQLEKDCLEEKIGTKEGEIADLKERNFDLEEKLSVLMLEETIKSEAKKEDGEEALTYDDEPDLAMISQNVEYEKESSILCSLLLYFLIVLLACVLIFWPELSRAVARDYPETADILRQSFKSFEESTTKIVAIALEYTPDSIVFQGQLMCQTAQNIASKAQEFIQLRGYEEYLDRASELMLEAQKRLRLA